MYALAAGAAGVGMLAVVQPAESEIVYTQNRQVINRNGIYAVDLNGDGAIDFLIQERFYSFFVSGAWVKEAFGNAVEVEHAGLAKVVSYGAVIGSQQTFASSKGSFGETMIRSFCTTTFCDPIAGYWRNVKNGYLGLRFLIDGQPHYGWAKLNVSRTNLQNVSTVLKGYAYETIPGKAIVAGQSVGIDDKNTAGPAVPDSDATVPPTSTTPGSLGALAAGVRGLSPERLP